MTCAHVDADKSNQGGPADHPQRREQIPCTCLGGNLYCLVIVDDYSRYTWVFFLHDKSEVASCFKKFAKRAQNEFEVKLKKIRSDNGKEFDNTNIEAYCDEVGIKHEVSATYTPQQNSVVERKNRTLITLARTMLDEYNTACIGAQTVTALEDKER